MQETPTDADLILRSLRHPGAFETILDRHYRPIYVYLAARVGLGEALDLTQEVFLQAFQHRRRYRRDRPNARPWLFAIARHLIAHHRREGKRRAGAILRMARLAQERAPDPAPEADDRLTASSLEDALRDGLSRLRQPDRDVLLLYTFGQLTYQEMAHVLDVPIGTVRSRLHRARAQLRVLLEDVWATSRLSSDLTGDAHG